MTGLARIVLAVLLVFRAVPAAAQELGMGLDALKHGQWEIALRTLVPLAEADNADAQYALGTVYANGDGVPVNLARADQLWRQAAQKGHARAREQLAFLRSLGPTAQTAAAANAGGDLWRLTRQYGEILAGTDLQAPLFMLPDGSQVVRVQAGPLSEERARDICAKLRDMNASCRVIRPEG
jgi:TPR repeat protein